MSRIQHFDKVTDEGFVPAVNEELKELRRKQERQAEKFQRLEKVTITISAGLGDREIKHNLMVVPKTVVIEVVDSGVAVSISFYKAHTSGSVFVRAYSAGTQVTINVVLRG